MLIKYLTTKDYFFIFSFGFFASSGGLANTYDHRAVSLYILGLSGCGLCRSRTGGRPRSVLQPDRRHFSAYLFCVNKLLN
jgi:hypothetical protein